MAGIATILFFTGTSLNIESFMGSIMCLGVSVSNSVMLVTFMSDHWKTGTDSIEAAIVGASERLRPILMTACAMTVGMVPMALALERGSQMQAPLGLAVIGGLVMSTFATLLVLPSVFAVVVGGRVAVSPSIYPDDRDSKYYDPEAFATENSDSSSHDDDDAGGHEIRPELQTVAAGISNGQLVHDQNAGHVGYEDRFDHMLEFPWNPQGNDPYITHHTTDELLGPLGFASGPEAGKPAGAPEQPAPRADLPLSSDATTRPARPESSDSNSTPRDERNT